MTVRLEIRHLYKVFSDRPQQAMAMLGAGKNKAEVLSTLNEVVGLDDVSLSVEEGAIYMIMGMSGSGKSTLARCINRLNEPSGGQILLDGDDLCALNEAALREVRRTRISMVFQHFALLPNRSVVENVEFGLKLRGVAVAKRRQRAEEVLNVVGLSGWSKRLPHELSGGMRQRVGLARALATDADILIMDEAFSALDPLIRSEMQDELLRLQKTFRKTILFITHDFQEALKLGTRIAIMADGRMVREGSPQEIVLSPGSDYVNAFTRDVDRARLFDAGSIMTALSPVWRGARGTIMADPGNPRAPAFLLNHDRRVVAHVPREELARLCGNGDEAMSASWLPPSASRFTAVRAGTKLVDVASRYRDDEPIAVTDDDGLLLGCLDASQLLARIGAGPSDVKALVDAHAGAHHG